MRRWLKKEYAKEYIIAGVGLTLTIIGCVLVIQYWEYVQNFQRWGYPGVFLLTLLTGSGLPIPLPYMLVVFTLGAVLKPALVGVASGLGCAVGQLILYVIGYAGRPFLAANDLPDSKVAKMYSRIPVWARRRTSLFIFLTNAVLNPLAVPITLAISASGFRTWKFFLASFAGNTVKSLIIAYCGYFGLGSILNWFGAV